MPVDSIILRRVQGDEEKLEVDVVSFMNTGPIKEIIAITSWSVGITVYIMIIYRFGDITHSTTETTRTSDVYGTALGLKPSYEY